MRKLVQSMSSTYMVSCPRYALARILTTVDISKSFLPDHCEVAPGALAGDGSLLRPFIVFFGEAVPMIEPAAEEAMQADIFVIIGTSLNVYPAAGLVRYTRPGTPIYLIDPDDVPADRNVTHIKKGASEGMKELISRL